jgi:hypothetical protein
MGGIRPHLLRSRANGLGDIEQVRGRIPLRGMRHQHRDAEHQARSIDEQRPFASVHLLARVVPAIAPFSAVLAGCESMIAALGSAFRPRRTRSSRRSWSVRSAHFAVVRPVGDVP